MAMPLANGAPPGVKTLHKSNGYKFSLFLICAVFLRKKNAGGAKYFF